LRSDQWDEGLKPSYISTHTLCHCSSRSSHLLTCKLCLEGGKLSLPIRLRLSTRPASPPSSHSERNVPQTESTGCLTDFFRIEFVLMFRRQRKGRIRRGTAVYPGLPSPVVVVIRHVEPIPTSALRRIARSLPPIDHGGGVPANVRLLTSQ
jgi:hypothetical protein